MVNRKNRRRVEYVTAVPEHNDYLEYRVPGTGGNAGSSMKMSGNIGSGEDVGAWLVRTTIPIPESEGAREHWGAIFHQP